MTPERPIIDPELSTIWPPLSADELAALRDSIEAEGVRDAFVVWRGILLDGHHRLAMCEELGLPYRTHEIALPDREAARMWIIRNQVGRRNVVAYVRCERALELEEYEKAKAKERMLAGKADPSANLREGGKTSEKLAELAGVSARTVDKARVIAREGSERSKAKLRQGKTSIDKVYRGLRTHEPSTRRAPGPKGKEEGQTPMRSLAEARLPGQTFASEERGVGEAVGLMKDAARILRRVRLKTGFGDSSKIQLREAIELIHEAMGGKKDASQ
jgi:ParB-like chromosome segregation protein Spo0J